MDEAKANIIRRFEEFGKSICGNKHGWKKQFADKLGIVQQNLTSILSGAAPIGGILQQRLRALGADVDYIMTGVESIVETADNSIRIHFSGTPSEQLKERTQRLAEWILAYGQDADDAYLGYITQKILQGKILNGSGEEIS